MNKCFKIVEPIKTQIPYQKDAWLDHVEISLSHTTGGISYFNNKTYNAGWYLHFTPVYIEKHDTYQSKSTILFHDRSFKMLCNDASRFSAKRFEKLKEELMLRKDKIVELYDNRKDKELFSYIQSTLGRIK